MTVPLFPVALVRWSSIPKASKSGTCPVPFILTEISALVTVGSRFFCPDRGKQVAKLVLDLPSRRDRLGDLSADQLAVTPPQAMDGYLECLGAHTQFGGEFCVRPGRFPSDER